MAKLTARYPGIAKACLEISLDNGGINRSRSQKKQSRAFEKWLERQPDDMIKPIDAWLSGLSSDQLLEVCCGGQDEPDVMALLANAPPFTNDLLNGYFEEVC